MNPINASYSNYVGLKNNPQAPQEPQTAPAPKPNMNSTDTVSFRGSAQVTKEVGKKVAKTGIFAAVGAAILGFLGFNKTKQPDNSALYDELRKARHQAEHNSNKFNEEANAYKEKKIALEENKKAVTKAINQVDLLNIKMSTNDHSLEANSNNYAELFKTDIKRVLNTPIDKIEYHDEEWVAPNDNVYMMKEHRCYDKNGKMVAWSHSNGSFLRYCFTQNNRIGYVDINTSTGRLDNGQCEIFNDKKEKIANLSFGF